MKCPFCSFTESKVIDSRVGAGADVTRRRRECEKCAQRFTTYERIEDVLPQVVKSDGRREPFDRQKIVLGLRRACVKRAVSNEAIDGVVDTIERELMESQDKEVSSRLIGEAILSRLRTLDEIAFVRFASVYRSFRDIREFREVLDEIGQKRA